MHAPLKRALYLLPLLSILAVSGCILSPDDGGGGDQPVVTYKALTDKENLIYNLMQTYKDCNIEEYKKLLYIGGTLSAFPDGYIWYNQAEDVQDGKDPFYTREQDITYQQNMFAAKLGTYPDPNKLIDALSLTIEAGSWQELQDIGGIPCTDCWTTTRTYKLELRIPSQDLTYVGNDLIAFYVVAVTANNRKEYRILRADDINDPQTP